jgi:hypothetical protein
MTDAMQVKEALLPCPFCGGKAEIERNGSAKQSCIIACEDCGCRLETGEIWSMGQRWNTRRAPSPAALDSVTVEACAKVCEDRIHRDENGEPLCGWDHNAAYNAEDIACAKAIRALIGQPAHNATKRERIDNDKGYRGDDPAVGVRMGSDRALAALDPETVEDEIATFICETEGRLGPGCGELAIAQALVRKYPAPTGKPEPCDCVVMCQDLGQGRCRYIQPGRDRLHDLVDAVYQYATESKAVPSTNVANKLIDVIFAAPASNPPGDTA